MWITNCRSCKNDPRVGQMEKASEGGHDFEFESEINENEMKLLEIEPFFHDDDSSS